MKALIFFQSLQVLERTFTMLGEKIFGRDIKIENCSLRPKRSIKKSNFWKFSFFSNSSKLWTNIYRAWRKTFWQGYQNWKLQSSSHKIKQKIKLLKNLFFFKIFRNLNEHLPCLAKKFWAGVSKLKIVLYGFRVSIWGWKYFFESFVTFLFFRTWNMKFLDLWQQSFHPGCQSCILLVYMNSLWDVGIRSDITWRKTLFEPWRKNFNLFLKTAFYVSKGTFWVKKNFLWKFWFFFKLFQTLNEPLLCLARKFSAGISKLKQAVFVS